MTFDQKYVVIDKGGLEVAVLFPELLDHSDFKKIGKVVSAGFFRVNFNRNNVSVYGQSTSLGCMKSRPQDAALIMQLLKGDTQASNFEPSLPPKNNIKSDWDGHWMNNQG